MRLAIPDMSLVVLVGASGSGKSTFAAKHFRPTQVLSSDTFRGLVCDDENDQSASQAAFDALHYVAGKRLQAGRVTVVDATNTQRNPRKELIELARAHHVLPVAIVLDVPESVCIERTRARADRGFGDGVVRRQRDELRRSLRNLEKEGFRRVHVLSSVDEVDAAEITIEPLLNDKRGETGPFDIIGDVHGCRAELVELLTALGYVVGSGGARHPDGRRAVFVGDLVDRGPDTAGVLTLVMDMVDAGNALAVCGNHEQKLLRALRGRKVTVSHGLAETLEQLAAQPDEFRERVRDFCDRLVAHYVLDGGKLVVAHAGLPQHYHGRASGAVRSFALYGDTTGETDEYGLPVRYPWADDYRGSATVVYGHTPTPVAEWINNTICLDTGCVFGGRLSALRYPEREVVSVAAQRTWYEPVKPLQPAITEAAALTLADVTGRRVIETGQLGRITVHPEQSAAALEVMSRFAVDPRWLLYLPPTMSPPDTSTRDGLLEHLDEALRAYRNAGVEQVMCQEKHMGSRAVILVCRDSGRERFGVDGPGVVHTRTGRAFFDPGLTEPFLDRVRTAATALFDELDTDWLLFDVEIMPWTAKAAGLVTGQYAPVGAAAGAVLATAGQALAAAPDRGVDVAELLERTRSRAANTDGYRAAYRRYCRPTSGLTGVTVAPFALLAAEGRSFATRPHDWHLAMADRLAAADPDLFVTTRRLTVHTGDDASVAQASRWWEELTASGAEGMVVKPAANLVRGRKGLVQPGIKVRGREYLRIIYGPDYTEDRHLTRLRERNLNRKRSLALREYAIGIEALDRVAAREPLWRIHECVFAVLALESDPVDPRL